MASVESRAGYLLPLGLLAAATVFASSRAHAPTWSTEPEPSPGERVFRQRCALCHSTGPQAGQGPGLAGIVGRVAASGEHFGYSRALRDSKLTWTPETLDQFLAAPARLVPATTMPMAVPDGHERHELVAYLTTLGAVAPSGSPARTGSEVLRRPAPPARLSGKEAFGNYRGDGPGVVRFITAADLPPPFATPSAQNGPSVVDPPAGAAPYTLPGFAASVFAKDLLGPRLLRVGPSGDVFVAESQAGQVRLLRARDAGPLPERREVFVDGLDRPFGIAFYPPGPDPKWIYVAETNSVVRFPYRNGDLHARQPRETVVARLTESTGGHWTRDLAFSRDGRRMLVSVGSASNVAEGSVDERDRADVLEFDPDGKNRRVFAWGIRNCVGLAMQPSTDDPWCSTNERDGLGDDLVPDYITRVRPNAFYGWPWYYLGPHPDPRHEGERPDLAGRISVPDVLLQAHSATLQIAFYDGAMFPARFRDGIFAALHGSWNRGTRTGPKVIFVPLKNDLPTGEYEDFVTGFAVDDDSVWARPVGVAVLHDGALLVGEDANGTIWRVAYASGAPSAAR